MADTQRTKAQIAALLANNSSNDVGAQDFRDLVESLDLSRGSFYMNGNSTITGTDAAGQDVYLLVGGATTANEENRFTHASPGRLTYDAGSATCVATVRATLVLEFAGAINVGVKIFKNGAEVASSVTKTTTASGAPQTVNCVAFGQACAATDYFEVWLAEIDAATAVDVIVTDMQVEVETYFA